jgi:restriction endonuclease S subunit
LVSEGDVLFLSRGQKLFAVALPDIPPNTIAAHYFYILKPDKSLILPEYLAWYINQTPAQNYIESRMRGSHMLMIPKSSFEQLEIIIPEFPIQRSIIELERLRRAEESLLTKLINARQRLVQEVSLRAV